MDKMTIKFRSNILKLNDENLAKEKIQKDFEKRLIVDRLTHVDTELRNRAGNKLLEISTKQGIVKVEPPQVNKGSVALSDVEDALKKGLISEEAFNYIVKIPSKPFKNARVSVRRF
tara:strand:+ start:49 stop:396 length:348 start_codon:yes stop_codon:yes gene_type:complete